jgi:phosphatidylinositol alpha-1,6-mannosyltransferase
LIRTLLLTPVFPPSSGGIQVLAHRLATHATGLSWRVVTLASPGAAEFDRAAGLDVRRAPMLPGPRPFSTLALNGAALAAARRFRPQAVLSAHLAVSPAAAALKRVLGIPVVQYFHAEEIGPRPWLARFAASSADLNIAVSRYTRDLVVDAGGPPDRIRLVHNGVDPPPAGAGSLVETASAERPTVLTVSRIEERYKGHDVMVRAMAAVRARVPDAQWVVVGDGCLRPGVERLARSTLADPAAIRFLGRVEDSERDAWLRRADVFAMPSRLPAGRFAGEGFGIAYLEAGANRLPVVAGAVGGALDAVVDGETGILVDPSDHTAVAAALIELLSDPERRRQMGAAGARRAESLSWSRAAGAVEALVRELTEHR